MRSISCEWNTLIIIDAIDVHIPRWTGGFSGTTEFGLFGIVVITPNAHSVGSLPRYFERSPGWRDVVERESFESLKADRQSSPTAKKDTHHII